MTMMMNTVYLLSDLSRKLIALLKAIFTADVPSPFDVVDMVIIDQFRRRLINSLRTFVKEKCVQVILHKKQHNSGKFHLAGLSL